MATITFNAPRQKATVRGHLDGALATLRKMLDASVSKLMRRVAAQAGYVAPRQTVFSRPTRTIIAVQPENPDQFRRTPHHAVAAIELDCTGRQPADEPASTIAEFQPLDPGVVSKTIPAFFIGRNTEGFWVARDAGGRIGGIFLFENSALWFARRHSGPNGCATIFPSDRVELDLENNGNPLVKPLGRLMLLSRSWWQRAAALTGRMAQAVKSRLEN